MKAGQLIKDGTVTWMIDDVRDGARVGDIILRPTLREGYIKANGATVQRADYPRLVAYVEEAGLWTDDTTAYPGLYGKGDGSTTMVLPDYRGHFLRALDDGRGIDTDRKLGSRQLASLMIGDDGNNTLTMTFEKVPVADTDYKLAKAAEYDAVNLPDYPLRSYVTAPNLASIDTTYLNLNQYWGGSRPRNVALIAQIKY